MAFEAKYAGRCDAACGEKIEVGDQITDQDGYYVHVECASEAPQETKIETCQTCWLVHRGECF